MMKIETKEEEILLYENIISINDSSKEFIPYWESTLKIIFNNYNCSIITNNHQNNEKTFKTLNLKLIEYESLKNNNSLFQIDVFKLKDEKEIKNENFIKKIKESYKNDNINVFLLNLSDNEKFNKVCTKIFGKIKDKIDKNDFFVIPYNKKKIEEDLFKNFFEALRKKFQDNFNKQLKNLFSEIETKNKDTNILQDEEKLYDYLNSKNKLINYYLFFDFWKDIKLICEFDLFKNYDFLKKNFEFNAPLNLLDNSIQIETFNKKISEKKISNIDIQQYLFYLYIKSHRTLKLIKDLMNFINRIIKEINIYHENFTNPIYFNLWKILFISNIILYLNNLRDYLIINENEENKKIFIESIIEVYNQYKKVFKVFANIIKFEIPNEKIFKNALNKNENDLINENEKIFILKKEEKEKDEEYNNLLNEIKNNESFKNIKYENYLEPKNFLVEYLKLLNEIENFYNNEFNYPHFSFKLLLEKIPILFIFNKFEDIKKIYINLMKKEEENGIKWNYIYEYFNFFLMIILNCLDKTDENLNILLLNLNIKMTRIKDMLKLIESEDENLINNIVSNYISSYQISSKDKIFKISLNKIIELNNEKENDCNIIYINQSKIKNKDINIIITNNSGYSFEIDYIKLIFKELYLKEENIIEYPINNNDLILKEIKSYEKNILSKFTIKLNDNENIFKINSIYQLIEIQLNLKNGIIGSYIFENGFKLNIKNLDLEITSSIFPTYDSPELKEAKFYYNILSLLNLDFKNFPSDLSDTILKIEITEFKKDDKKIDDQINIQKNILEEYLTSKNIKSSISKNYIEFPQNSINDKSIFSYLKIPFYIENINYFEEEEKTLKITSSILKGEEIIYSFVEFQKMKLIHLFHLKNKYRLMPNQTYIMQLTFSLNIEIDGVNIYMNNTNKNIINLDIMQAMNIILVFKNDLKEIEKECEKNFFKFSIDLNNKTYFYKFCYPKMGIIEDIKELMNMPYHIIIDINNDIEHQVFQEFDINVKIKKYSNKNIIFMSKIKDNENWGVIGKSKIILNLPSDLKEGEIKFKLFPLLDGYIKIPEIEFFEYEIVENQNNINDNYSGVQFKEIDFGSFIEGNERIIKINSINEYTLRLNLT